MIIQESGKRNGHRHFLCECDCGNQKIIAITDLRNGRSKSCGCFRKEINQKIHFKHGQSKSRLYSVWCSMRQRCLYENNSDWHNYGGRGISICENWKNFRVFRDWALVSGYRDNLTIERINNNGNYSPSNCTWIPLSEQSKNTRRNKRITFNGKTKILKEWAKELNFTYSTLKFRLIRGWSVERAFTTPHQITDRQAQC